MTAPATRDPNDGLAALERLYAKNVVTLEEAQAAAKLLTGDPNTVFPPPAPPAPPAPAAAPAPPAPSPAAAKEPDAPAGTAAPSAAEPAAPDNSSDGAPQG